MKRLIEFPLEDGSTILVQVDEPELEGGTTHVFRPGEVAEKARITFEEAVSKTRPAAERIIAILSDMRHPPDQVGVEFGINLSAEAGAFVASVSAEANFKVILTWRREK